MKKIDLENKEVTRNENENTFGVASVTSSIVKVKKVPFGE